MGVKNSAERLRSLTGVSFRSPATEMMISKRATAMCFAGRIFQNGTFSVPRPLFKNSEGAVAREGGKGGAEKGVSTRS